MSDLLAGLVWKLDAMLAEWEYSAIRMREMGDSAGAENMDLRIADVMAVLHAYRPMTSVEPPKGNDS